MGPADGDDRLCGLTKQILIDPAEAFASPDEVVTGASLTREQKIRILKVWENDAAAVVLENTRWRAP